MNEATTTPHRCGSSEALTARDRRYTVNQEYTGEPGPRYVARFCRGWISSHDTAEEARRACEQHYRARMPVYTADFSALEARVDMELLRKRARTAKRKMAQCIKLARETRRDSWQQPQPYRTRYRQISREAMEDARYWHAELQQVAPYV